MALNLFRRNTTSFSLWRLAFNSRPWQETFSSATANGGTKRFEEMPTERGSSWLFGVGPEMASMPRGEFFSKMRQKYGKLFRLKIGRKYMVVVADVEGVETVIRNEGKYPSRGEVLKAMSLIINKDKRSKGVPMADSSITALEGKEWKELRSTLNPGFVPRKLGRHVHKLNAVNDTFVRVAQEGADVDGYSKDLMDLLPYWSMEAISRFLLPQGIQFQGPDAPGAEAVEGFQAFLENSALCDMYPTWWLKTVPVKAYQKARDGYTCCIGAQTVLVEEAIKQQSAVSNDEDKTFLETYVEQGMDATNIVYHLSSFISAGVDTTANTAAFALYQLAKHPEVQEEACKEVLSVVGRDGAIDDAALQKMPFVKACMKETTRMYPTAGNTVRSLPVDLEIGGYVVPQKTFLLVSNLLMGADPDYFEDPLMYKPERWLRGEDSVGINPFLVNDFGFGPRMCLGRRVAELEIWSLLAKVLQKTRLELHEESDNIGQTGRATLRPGKPLRVKFAFLQ